MKNNIFLTVLLFFIKPLFAQEKFPVNLQVKAGNSIPLATLGEARNDSSGFAQSGRVLSLNLLVPLFKGIDITFGYSNIAMNVNRTKFDKFTENKYRNELEKNLYVTNNFSYLSTLDKYSNNSLLVGVKFDVRLNSKVDLYFNPTLTYTWVQFPNVSVVIKDSLYQIGISQSSKIKSDFGFQLNGGIKYKTSENLNILLDLAYFSSIHNSENKASSRNQNNVPLKSNSSGEFIFSSINLTVGLQFNLSKK